MYDHHDFTPYGTLEPKAAADGGSSIVADASAKTPHQRIVSSRLQSASRLPNRKDAAYVIPSLLLRENPQPAAIVTQNAGEKIIGEQDAPRAPAGHLVGGSRGGAGHPTAPAAAREDTAHDQANPRRAATGGYRAECLDAPYERATLTRAVINMALAAEGAAIAEALRLPRVSDLVHSAIVDTDFLSDLSDDQRLLQSNVENSVDLAADIWSDAHGFVTVPLSLIVLARSALMAEAQDMLEDRAQHAADRLYDARMAGDVDADGEPIPYPMYRNI